MSNRSSENNTGFIMSRIRIPTAFLWKTSLRKHLVFSNFHWHLSFSVAMGFSLFICFYLEIQPHIIQRDHIYKSRMHLLPDTLWGHVLTGYWGHVLTGYVQVNLVLEAGWEFNFGINVYYLSNNLSYCLFCLLWHLGDIFPVNQLILLLLNKLPRSKSWTSAKHVVSFCILK